MEDRFLSLQIYIIILYAIHSEKLQKSFKKLHAQVVLIANNN